MHKGISLVILMDCFGFFPVLDSFRIFEEKVGSILLPERFALIQVSCLSLSIFAGHSRKGWPSNGRRSIAPMINVWHQIDLHSFLEDHSRDSTS